MIEVFLSYITRLFPGSNYKRIKDINQDKKVIMGKGNKSVFISWNTDNFQLIKEENFSANDINILSVVINKLDFLQTQIGRSSDVFQRNIVENLFDDLILSDFIGIKRNSKQKKDIVGDLLKTISFWRNKTYEGKNISLGIIIDYTASSNTKEYIFDTIMQDYFAPISDGMNSFIKIDINGNLIGYSQFNQFYDDALMPYRFSTLKNETSIKAIILTRLGDILLVSDGEIKYVKKDTQWIQYNSQNIIRRLTATIDIHDEQLKKAIFQTCIDVSFAKTGCVIGIVDSKINFNLSNLISNSISEDKEYQKKVNVINGLLKKRKFQLVERELRKELASIDGCVIIDNIGKIICIGSILKISGGSLGGGRTAAAVAISKYGIGIKVSMDGYIQLFRNGEKKQILRID
jgi:DNA integrity scanning protein DisA with diadenylate cyclase activity